jgi:hypothetical protein
MTKVFSAAVKQIQAQTQARQTRLKDQLKAVTAFPKELRRVLPVYSALCKMSSAIPCTMGSGGYLVIDDMGERGSKEFEAARDTIDGLIVAVVIYVEYLWSASFGFRENDENKFWKVCPEFYGLSGLDGGWKQYATAWENHVRRGKTARRGKALIDNWKRERVKAQRVVDHYRRWWNSFWKAHPDLAAEYEDKQS